MTSLQRFVEDAKHSPYEHLPWVCQDLYDKSSSLARWDIWFDICQLIYMGVGWIEETKEKPDFEGLVLVYMAKHGDLDKSGSIYMSSYDKETKRWLSKDSEGLENDMDEWLVTHWMPLAPNITDRSRSLSLFSSNRPPCSTKTLASFAEKNSLSLNFPNPMLSVIEMKAGVGITMTKVNDFHGTLPIIKVLKENNYKCKKVSDKNNMDYWEVSW